MGFRGVVARYHAATALLISGLAGLGTMVLELSAVRLLGPWFGTSLVVWTNVIAVILLALAMGYLLGGRMAMHDSPFALLSWILLSAGAIVAWLPQWGSWLARALLPEEIALHEAARLVGWGSLAVACLVFLLPATLLGTTCPLVVEGLARGRGLSPGRAGGVVLFVSTLGSLAGVFSTSHLLLPVLGLRRTFLLVGGILVAAGVLAMLLGSRAGVALRGGAILIAVALSSAWVAPATRSLQSGCVELARRESAYQTLRVVEDRRTDVTLRLLQVNEGLDSFQSVWRSQPGLLPAGFYYNDFLLPLLWSPENGRWRVLVLGLGAGTVVRVFEGENVDAEFIGVELDPVIVELGQQFFGCEAGHGLTVWSGLDARVALRIQGGPFDQIILDCYANQVEIPHHLCTTEFFQEVRARLSVGGWLSANLGGFDFDDAVVSHVAATCSRAFGAPVLLVRVPLSRNYVLMARRDGALPVSDGILHDAIRPSSLALGPRRLPAFSRIVDPRGDMPVLTDDWCPIEILQLRSLTESRKMRRAQVDQ